MKKNYLIFLILSVLTIFIWNSVTYFNKKHFEKNKNNSSSVIKGESILLNDYSNELNNTTKAKLITLTNDYYKITFTNKGAAILNCNVKEKNKTWIDLIPYSNKPILSTFSNVYYNIIPISNKKIIFYHKNLKDGWIITKTYNLSNNHMHNVNVSIKKIVGKNVVLPKINFSWNINSKNDANNNFNSSKLLVCEDSTANKIKKIKNDAEIIASLYKWIAIDSKYFLIAFIPKEVIKFDKIFVSKITKNGPYSILLNPKQINKNDTSLNYSIRFFIGPKKYDNLRNFNLGLEKTIDFGFFGFLGKLAFNVLKIIHNITNNYGWAIVLLTIIVQILLLPLTVTSFKSISTIRKLHPIIKNIQEKYKDDPKRLQLEILNVYRLQGVNPLGGCLPMLLQLPVFWAFFTMLRNIYELRNENWIFWIKDLSSPDNLFNIGQFKFNLLPLIMGLSMFFQQKITNTVTTDANQKKMLYIIPIMFTFMFWTFPSGLVIYWTINNIVSIIEQSFILWRERDSNPR
ncbi:MAG: membrane protein insertase YidC [Endomicrobium sp.]|nr:membrane protein insertase YidC [Endomicrobium sp.]